MGRTAKWLVALAAAAAGLGASASEGDKDYRVNSMKAVGGHMQALVGVLRGEVPHSEHLALHAGALADLAEIAPTLFPEGSESDAAKSVIWEQPEDFKAKLAAFKEAAAGLKEVAGSGDMAQIGPATQKLGQACKGCHDEYRQE